MEYAIHTLARLSGVSTRTLRYYDSIGLLKPVRTSANGCRIYGAAGVDRLQQILFYREMGVPLEEIGRILDAPGYDPAAALTAHLADLQKERDRLDVLIGNVTRTIGTLKGEAKMTDKEKFAGFKKKLVADNEAAYGAEIRQKYGDEAVDAANARVLNMSEQQSAAATALQAQCEELLRQAAAKKDVACDEARRACALHAEWLQMFWKKGTYTKAAHRGLGEMYAADERFAAYYDRLAPGCAAFFRDAIAYWCAD